MTLEIKTATLDSVRNTFAHIERRFGDKPATRYQEATYDVQSEKYLHYRPLWQPDKELNDSSRTDIKMTDWYAFRDPRQLYYGTYVQQRSKMQEAAENSYSFFEKRNLVAHLDDEIKHKLVRFLVPLRHMEQAANLNNMFASSYGYGTAITQACLFNGMDRLGIAQYLSRVGLILDGNSGDSLVQAKQFWMDDEIWQGLRANAEELTTTEDWFEVMIAQNVVVDSLVYDLYFHQFDVWLQENNAQDVGMLMEFMQVWSKESNRWVDAVLKTAVAESDDNKVLIEQWISQWKSKLMQSLEVLSSELLGVDALRAAEAVLNKRLAKAGLFK